MKHWIVLSAVCSLLASSAAFANDEAAPKPGDKPHRRPPHDLIAPPGLKELGLSAEQEAKYKAINQEFVKERDKWLADHKGEGKDAKPDNNQGDDKGARQQRREEMKPLMELRHKYTEQLRSALTPEQNKKLDEARERMHRRHEEHAPKDEGEPKP